MNEDNILNKIGDAKTCTGEKLPPREWREEFYEEEAKMIFDFLNEIFCTYTLGELKKILPLGKGGD